MAKKLPLDSLLPDSRNPNKGTGRGRRAVLESLKEYGAGRSIVLDRHGNLIAGNKTAAAAAELGMENVLVVETTGNQLVAVKRLDLDLTEKGGKARALSVADNRAAERGLSWDLAQLAEDLGAGLTLPEALFATDELSAMLQASAEAAAALGAELERGQVFGERPEPAEGAYDGPSGLVEGVDPDECPEDAPTRVQPGELWQLGRHRLLCGDSTLAENVARLLGDEKPALMVTDPPYGVEYDPGWRNDAAEKGLIAFAASREGKVANDDRASWAEAWALFPGAVVYCWHAGRRASEVSADLVGCGFEIRSQIIWRKPRFVISRGHYHWQHEPCWYAVRKGATASWCGDRSQTTVWDIALTTDGDKTEHGTQKPVECMRRPLRNHEGDVYDPFLGSGSTLIAAEMMGRRCFGLELMPRYCDMIVSRFEKATGQPARRLD